MFLGVNMRNIEAKNNSLLTAKPFQYLDHSELEMLLSYCKIIKFSKNELLVQQGKLSKGMYVLIKGKALITAKILGNDVLQLATLEQGNFIGEVGLMDKTPATITAIASEPLECLLITTAYFEMLALFFPKIKYKVTKAIAEEVCHRLKTTQKKIRLFMLESDMATRSLFSEVINSLSTPLPISFEKSGVDINKLQLSQVFQYINAEENNELLKFSNLIHTIPNCTLLKENAKNITYFILLAGAVTVNIVKDNKIAKIAVLGPISFFGSSSYIDELPSNLSYTTCERAMLLTFSETNFALLKEKNIQLWYKIFDSICKSFIHLEKLIDKLNIRLHSESYNR